MGVDFMFNPPPILILYTVVWIGVGPKLQTKSGTKAQISSKINQLHNNGTPFRVFRGSVNSKNLRDFRQLPEMTD